MNNPPDSPTPARAPLWQRLLRSLVLIILGVTCTFLAGLALAGYVPATIALLNADKSIDSAAAQIALTVTLLILFFLPLVLLNLALRRRWLTRTVLGSALLLTMVVLTWLSWDEAAIRRPLPIEEFSPAFSGAEKSHAVLMQYSKQTPSDEAKESAKVKMTAIWGGTQNTREPAKWIEFVTKHRAAIEADWATLAPQRRWLDELNAFDRISDLSPAKPEANLISFQVWRTLSQRSCAIATLQALDGHGDEAIATLLPMLEAGRKLLPSSRTLVRSMISIVVERMCVETAGVILDQTPVSATNRARLAAAFAGGNASAQARRLFLVEYAQITPVIGSLRMGDSIVAIGSGRSLLRRPLNFVSGILINPNATTNLYGDFVYELADLAEARELGKLTVRTKTFLIGIQHRPGMKNLGGRLLLNMAVPSYEKVIDSYWKTVDLRDGLQKRLAEPEAK